MARSVSLARAGSLQQQQPSPATVAPVPGADDPPPAGSSIPKSAPSFPGGFVDRLDSDLAAMPTPFLLDLSMPAPGPTKAAAPLGGTLHGFGALRESGTVEFSDDMALQRGHSGSAFPPLPGLAAAAAAQAPLPGDPPAAPGGSAAGVQAAAAGAGARGAAPGNFLHALRWGMGVQDPRATVELNSDEIFVQAIDSFLKFASKLKKPVVGSHFHVSGCGV